MNNPEKPVKQTWKVEDIAGSKVFDEQGTCVGELIDVLPTGGNDVWVLKTDLNSSGELLLPALASVVKKIDTAAKKIYIVMPAGLKEVFEDQAGTEKEEPKQF